jgi:hypothetical protein
MLVASYHGKSSITRELRRIGASYGSIEYRRIIYRVNVAPMLLFTVVLVLFAVVPVSAFHLGPCGAEESSFLTVFNKNSSLVGWVGTAIGRLVKPSFREPDHGLDSVILTHFIVTPLSRTQLRCGTRRLG